MHKFGPQLTKKKNRLGWRLALLDHYNHALADPKTPIAVREIVQELARQITRRLETGR